MPATSREMRTLPSRMMKSLSPGSPYWKSFVPVRVRLLGRRLRDEGERLARQPVEERHARELLLALGHRRRRFDGRDVRSHGRHGTTESTDGSSPEVRSRASMCGSWTAIHRSASSAAMQPVPAAVTACR